MEGEAIMFEGSIRAGFLAALVLCAAGALAQSAVSNSYDVNLRNAVTVNNCSASEPVALSGDVHISYSVTTDSSGNNNFSISAANNLTGSGQKTGGVYLANDSDTYSSSTSDPSADLTVELKSALAPQNGGSGLTLVQSLHIVVDTTGNISVQVVGNTTNCGS
jgi:hypothetical protein